MKLKYLLSTLVISSLMFTSTAFANHHEGMDMKMSPEQQKMHDEMVKVMKDNSTLLSKSSSDMLDAGLSMLKSALKNKNVEESLKSVKIIKEGLELNQKIMKIAHSHNLESHDVMHKKHMEMHKKAFDTVMSASSELVKSGSELIKEGKDKNDSDLIMKGNSLLEASIKMLMMNPHHNEKAHNKMNKSMKKIK